MVVGEQASLYVGFAGAGLDWSVFRFFLVGAD